MHPVKAIKYGLHHIHLPHVHPGGAMRRTVHSREFWMWVGLAALFALFLLLVALTPSGSGTIQREILFSPYIY